MEDKTTVMDNEKMVTLMRFTSDGEANLYKSLLDANGVNNALVGEYANDIYPLASEWFPIRLLVAPEDVQQAKAVLSAEFDPCEFLEETGETDGE